MKLTKKEKMGNETKTGFTPDQLSTLKKLGSVPKAGVVVVQPKVQEVQAQPESKEVSRIVQAEIDQSQVSDGSREMDRQERNSTYLKLVNKDDADEKPVASLEIDLKTYRERGEEIRYVSILFSGFDVREEEQKRQEAFFNITSKEDFEIIKDFFSKLNWED